MKTLTRDDTQHGQEYVLKSEADAEIARARADALEIDPEADLEKFPEALAFQIDMARAVIRAALPQPQPQSAQAPLTEKRIHELWHEFHPNDAMGLDVRLARAVEREHGIVGGVQ